jgi:uracil-DNA glycosylase family 4
MASSRAQPLTILNRRIVACRQCPRLVRWRERVAREKRAAFREWEYWARPVPGFGEASAELLLLGLAPAAHGGNRTGRVFTGDRSGDFLYAALHRAGFANQPTSINRDDALRLKNCYITASVKCAPPENKPRRREQSNCRPYLIEELRLLPNLRAVLALGKIAFDTYLDALEDCGLLATRRGLRFTHGIHYDLPLPSKQCEDRERVEGDAQSARHQARRTVRLFASYHPSQRNTQTGLLTSAMFDHVLRRIAQCLCQR